MSWIVGLLLLRDLSTPALKSRNDIFSSVFSPFGRQRQRSCHRQGNKSPIESDNCILARARRPRPEKTAAEEEVAETTPKPKQSRTIPTVTPAAAPRYNVVAEKLQGCKFLHCLEGSLSRVGRLLKRVGTGGIMTLCCVRIMLRTARLEWRIPWEFREKILYAT